jgi:hypothetical protein|tara:strand:- start:228 stop:458 length:231 start_codon:yes stop_codon:yes gene_type:complete
MSPEANLLRLAYIDINALLVEGFDTNAQNLVDWNRADELKDMNDLYPSVLAVAKTLTEIRDLFGADDMNRPGYFDC